MSEKSSSHPKDHVSGPTRTVRPRWSWGGLVALLLGLAAVGWAIIVLSMWWAVIGAVATVAGAVAAVRGGLLYDVDTTFSPGTEVDEAAAGEPHEGPTPQARLEDAQAQETARAATEQTRRRTRASAAAPRPPAGPLGIMLVLVVCLWLLVAQWALIPVSTTGRDTGVRDLVVAVVVALAAFRLRAGFSRPALGLCVLGGLVLVLSAFLLGHSAQRSSVNEVICGAAIIAGSLLTLDRGRRRGRSLGR